jgi:predicted nucleotidyltransferase
MKRDQLLKIIADHRKELAGDFGVKSLALFGSVVRDEATAASDVDLLVEFDDRPVGLFHLSRTRQYLESILGVPRVDLVLRDGIKPALKDRILREAVYAAWRLDFPEHGTEVRENRRKFLKNRFYYGRLPAARLASEPGECGKGRHSSAAISLHPEKSGENRS